MNDSDAKIMEFFDMFPDCPNPAHHPLQFKYFINMFLNIKKDRLGPITGTDDNNLKEQK